MKREGCGHGGLSLCRSANRTPDGLRRAERGTLLKNDSSSLNCIHATRSSDRAWRESAEPQSKAVPDVPHFVHLEAEGNTRLFCQTRAKSSLNTGESLRLSALMTR